MLACAHRMGHFGTIVAFFEPEPEGSATAARDVRSKNLRGPVVPARQMNGDRRLQCRSVVGSQLAARINYIYDASVINISASGVMIEHRNHVRPGTVSFVTLLFHVKPVGLKCRVIRSVVHRYEVDPSGERILVYRTGFQFLNALAGTPSLTQ
jgi:hypothetical protein